jgi:hypothetical protein
LPSEKPARRIQDIIDNAIAIERYVGRVAFAEFERDHKTRDSVGLSRTCQRDLAEDLMPEQPRRSIRAFGIAYGMSMMAYWRTGYGDCDDRFAAAPSGSRRRVENWPPGLTLR